MFCLRISACMITNDDDPFIVLKQIIADHDPVQLVEKLKVKHTVERWDRDHEFFPDRSGWTPTKWMTTWLPFGYMCLHNIVVFPIFVII